MFTLEQIDDLHAQLGSAKTLPEYDVQLSEAGNSTGASPIAGA